MPAQSKSNLKKFEELKPEIEKAVNTRLQSGVLPSETGGYILVDGFFMHTFQKEVSGSISIGGPSIPSVALVGKSSGRIYFFALKVLLPGIEI